LYHPCSVANIYANWLHGINHKFIILIRVVLAIIWSLWIYRNENAFNDENVFLMLGYLPVHQYTPFMVVSTVCGEFRPIYGGYSWLEATVRDTFS
jgi:hypothetical protein